MSPKRMMALSIPILIIAGGLSFGKRDVYSFSVVSPHLSHTQSLETGESNSALLLAKKRKRAAAPKGFKPAEELEFRKAQPKGKPPAIKKRPTKQQLEQLIQKNKGSKKAAQNAQMLSNAKKRKSSGRVRKAAPPNFKSKEDLDLEKSQFKGKQPPIKKRRPRAMGLDSLPAVNEPEAPTIVRDFSQDHDWLSNVAVGAGTLFSTLNPFAVSEAHAQTPLSLVFSPTAMGSGSNYIRLYGGYTNYSNWFFYSTTDYSLGHSNIRPYVYLRVNIPTAGYYTFNFRTYGYRSAFVLADGITEEEIESWPYVSGSPYGTYEQPTILELDQGYHYFKFYSTRSSSSTRFLEVTVNSF
jgi:hypothetical protein